MFMAKWCKVITFPVTFPIEVQEHIFYGFGIIVIFLWNFLKGTLTDSLQA